MTSLTSIGDDDAEDHRPESDTPAVCRLNGAHDGTEEQVDHHEGQEDGCCLVLPFGSLRT